MNTRPKRIGKFEIIEPLGEGAMGAVFLARDTIIGREVALKTLHPAVVAAPEARERFFRETTAASRLDHPNLVATHEAGEDAGVVFLAMEYVGGASLAQVLKEGSLKPLEILELLAQVCDGLAYAHARGVFHQDIKPANIRVTRVSGRPTAKILDFGIPRLAGSDVSSTASITGTFNYMAPEHTRTAKPDAKADLFAVGVILYEALAGFRPFDGDNAALTLERLIHEEPAPLDPARLDTISPAIQGVVDQALAKDPTRRFATAAALASALRAARNPAWSPQADAERMERTAQSRLIPGLTRPQEAPRAPLNPAIWISLLGAVAALALLAAGAYFWLRHRHQKPLPPPVVVQPAPPPPVLVPPPAEPAPAPEPETPKVPESKSRYKTLDEADAALIKDPQEALVFLEETLAANPADERALALRMVALYSLGRFGACSKAMGEAKASGHPLLDLSLKYPRFRRMLDAEKANPRLPRKAKPAQE